MAKLHLLWVTVVLVLMIESFEFVLGAPRVLHGSNVKSGQFPFVGLIVGGSECGCTLVKKDAVLTAAHCVKGLSPAMIRVGFGGISRSHLLSFKEIHEVKSVRVHPKFYFLDHVAHYDVAILKLKTPSKFPTVELNMKKSLEMSGVPILVGWGLNGLVRDALQYAPLGIVPDRACSTMFKKEAAREICAGNGFFGACEGDSGGPLLVKVQSRWVQIGISSYAPLGCVRRDGPSVFASVEAFKWWIKKNM